MSMQKKSMFLASLAAVFMLAGCGEESVDSTAPQNENQPENATEVKGGYVTEADNCYALYNKEVLAKDKAPDIEDYYILSRTPDGKEVKEACRFAENEDKEKAPTYELYNLGTNSFCTGTTESRYPYTCYYNNGITEEYEAKRQNAKNALRP